MAMSRTRSKKTQQEQAWFVGVSRIADPVDKPARGDLLFSVMETRDSKQDIQPKGEAPDAPRSANTPRPPVDTAPEHPSGPTAREAQPTPDGQDNRDDQRGHDSNQQDRKSHHDHDGNVVNPNLLSHLMSMQNVSAANSLSSLLPEDMIEIVEEPEERPESLPAQIVSLDGRAVQVTAEGRIEAGAPVVGAHYEVVSVLGQGGMGVVCLARQQALGRNVALKLMRRPRPGDRKGRQRVARFISEAQMTGRLDHPNVVPVYNLAVDASGQPFYTMKMVPGTSWQDLLDPTKEEDSKQRKELEDKAASMTLEDHLAILDKVCNAVAYAHAKSVLHRDIKPANVMLGEFGEVLLADWGLAIAFGKQNPYVLDPKREVKLAGTPAYMAPEMARGHMDRIGPATDVYLLGGILYRLLVGEAPHSSNGNIVNAVRDAASGKVKAPWSFPDRQVDMELAAVCMKALATDMRDRYQTVPEFQQALSDYRTHSESLRITNNASQQLDELVALTTNHDRSAQSWTEACEPTQTHRKHDDTDARHDHGADVTSRRDGNAHESDTVHDGPAVASKEHVRTRKDDFERALLTVAARPMDDCEAAKAYALAGQSAGAFRQALALWTDNLRARRGLIQSLQLHFTIAVRQGDLTLARHALEELKQSLASSSVKTNTVDRHRMASMQERLDREVARTKSQRARMRWLRLLATSMTIAILAGLAIISYLLLRQARLVSRQNRLVRNNLVMSRQRVKAIHQALLLSDRLRRTSFAKTVATRAKVLSQYLRGIEQLDSQYAQIAGHILSMPANQVPYRPRTRAKRKGYYLDQDYASSRTRPDNMVADPRYGRAVSLSHGTVKLAPWAQRRRRLRKAALDDIWRLSRLSNLFASVHASRKDIVWTVFGTKTGALLSFPGFRRYGRHPDYDPTKRPWYRAGIRSGHPIWSRPHIDAAGHGVLVTCVQHFVRSGRIAGVVGIELTMKSIQEHLVEDDELGPTQQAQSTGTHQAARTTEKTKALSATRTTENTKALSAARTTENTKALSAARTTQTSRTITRALLLLRDGSILVDTTYWTGSTHWKKAFAMKHVYDLEPTLARYGADALAHRIPHNEAQVLHTQTGPVLAAYAPLGHPDWTLVVLSPESAQAVWNRAAQSSYQAR